MPAAFAHAVVLPKQHAGPTVEVQLEDCRVTERDALAMAKSLERAGAPARDVKFALDRAHVAKQKTVQLLSRAANRAA